MSPQIRDAARAEDGFTLIELLTAIALGIIVLLAAYACLDTFTRNSNHQIRTADASDQVRQRMDATVIELRNASRILKAQADDLAYAVPISATQSRVRRLCVSGGRLRASTEVVTGTPTAPTPACASLTDVGNLETGTTTAFTYDGAASAADPLKVRNVGITLGLRARTAGLSTTSTLRASAGRRSSGTLPIPPDAVTTACEQSTGKAILDLATGIGGTGALSVTYQGADGASLGLPTGTQLKIPAGVTKVIATITDSLGATGTVETEVTCTA